MIKGSWCIVYRLRFERDATDKHGPGERRRERPRVCEHVAHIALAVQEIALLHQPPLPPKCLVSSV